MAMMMNVKANNMFFFLLLLPMRFNFVQKYNIVDKMQR